VQRLGLEPGTFRLQTVGSTAAPGPPFYKIVVMDYLMAKDLELIPKIDWCKAVVEDLNIKARAWNRA